MSCDSNNDFSVISTGETIDHVTCDRVKIDFCDNMAQLSLDSDVISKSKAPVFEYKNNKYVLIKHLCQVFNYPSSYHLIKKIIKSTQCDKSMFQRSDSELNNVLLDNDIITEDDTRFRLFYCEFSFIYSIIDNKDILLQQEEEDDDMFVQGTRPPRLPHMSDEDKITINQIFPQYGMESLSLPHKHSTFNSLTNLSKFNYLKAMYPKMLAPTKLTANELEILYNLNDYNKLEVKNDEIIEQLKQKNQRKPLGKPKKHNLNVDPNNLDLSDSIIPGQGYIQEFNISHICKVPNYYIINQQQQQHNANNTASSTAAAAAASSLNLPTKKNEGTKVSRNVSQLVFNNDYDYFNFGKYFYTKTYRGPGSGNYKDASLVNRINKIPQGTKLNEFKRKHKTVNPKALRTNNHVKGLVHEHFNKYYVDYIINKQRNVVEDYNNLEVLHNSLQFNLLLNTYRSINDKTWDNYYKFKAIDFEQLILQKSPINEALLRRFALPSDYPEIINSLPTDVRNDVKHPLYFNLKYPDIHNPQLMTNVEIVKLPNANEIAWDNLKKYSKD